MHCYNNVNRERGWGPAGEPNNPRVVFTGSPESTGRQPGATGSTGGSTRPRRTTGSGTGCSRLTGYGWMYGGQAGQRKRTAG